MQANNGQGNWTFRTEDVPPVASTSVPQQRSDDIEPVTWTASEFIAHHKNGGWYATAIFGCASLCVLIYIFTHDFVSIIAITTVVILFLIISGKKPQQQAYIIDSHGVTIGSRLYPYSTFKSFAVSYEGAIGCITFVPLRRFMPEIAVYYAPDDENRILEALSRSLPNDQRSERNVDRLMKRIHF